MLLHYVDPSLRSKMSENLKERYPVYSDACRDYFTSINSTLIHVGLNQLLYPHAEVANENQLFLPSRWASSLVDLSSEEIFKIILEAS